MANRRKKDKVMSFFKKGNIPISLFYKPSGIDIDVFHVVIIDDTLQLRFKVNGNVVVIDEVKPISDDNEAINNIAMKLITYFINQTSYNILISKLGNIPAISLILDKLDVPVVDDERFITIPISLYKKYIEYYKDNRSYGFYLMNVLDDISTVDDDSSTETDDDIDKSNDTESEEDTSTDIRSNSSILTPLELKQLIMNELIDMAKLSGKFSINSYTEYSMSIDMVTGISMELSVSLNEITISDIKFSPNSPTTELLTFINSLLDKFNSQYEFNIYTNENDKNVTALCGVLDFQNMTPSSNNRGRIVYHKGVCNK